MTQQSPSTIYQAPHRKPSFFQKLFKTSPRLAKLVTVPTALTLIALNTTVFGLPIWFVGAYKVATKSKWADNYIIGSAKKWINVNNYLIDTLAPQIDWYINMPKDLDANKKYLVMCNHLSSMDIAVMQYISHSPNVPIELPLTRFFTKFGAIYIPFLGQAFYFLDFPMIKRHKPTSESDRIALNQRNAMEAKKSCDALRDKPFCLLNYLEGTRFTHELHDKQNSPYKNLLKPKAGGIATAISALGDDIDGILNMTVVYPQSQTVRDRFMSLWKGKITQLGADIEHISMPEDLFEKVKNGGYNNDPQTKEDMFAWLDTVWQEKDKKIDEMLQGFE